MAEWYLANKKCDFKAIGDELGVDQVLVRIMRNRGYETADEMRTFLNGGDELEHSYENLKGLDEALDILMEKIDEGLPIRIIGDYDVDGITSTYILWKGLSLAGAAVDTVIPHRIRDGYGINVDMIDEAYKAGVDTILTCDNGIAAAKAFEHAKELGLTCIVTDHHEIPYEEEGGVKHYILPQVEAVVDPKQEDCPYPFKEICGAVVAYKLMQGLFDALGMDTEDLKELKELAGIATVCDVMPLVDENRYLVKNTLRSLKNARNTGIRALVKTCELENKNITSHSIGFVIGPCINATGRLDSADIGLELLQSESIEEGLIKAARLKELNEARKTMTESSQNKAREIIEAEGMLKDKVIVTYIPGMHESLAGIVAGRIREYSGKPAFILTDGEGCLKGSARSIEAYHIYEAMSEISDVFLKFGGHAMAAGFSIEKDRLEEFRRRINENCRLSEADYIERITIDVPMPMAYVTEKLVEQLSLLEPFGNGNEKPVFAQKNVSFTSVRLMGNGKMAKFAVRTPEGGPFELVLFRNLDKFSSAVDDKYGPGCWQKFTENVTDREIVMDVIYYPGINEFRGNKNLQFVMTDYR